MSPELQQNKLSSELAENQPFLCAVVSGQLTGLGTDSLAVRSQLPGARLVGQAKTHVAVNAVSGNVCLSSLDVSIQDRGVNWPIGFVYNSLNKNPWKIAGLSQVSSVTGTLNTAGSSLSFIDSHGGMVTYSYDVNRKAYAFFDADLGLITLTQQSNSTWSRVIEKTGITETYDAQGLLIAREDANGNKTNITRTSNSSTSDTCITLPSGQAVHYVRTGATVSIYNGDPAQAKPLQIATIDSSGKIQQLQIGDSYFLNYTYDACTGCLNKISQSDGSSLSFQYDSQKRLQKISDGTNRFQQFQYASGSLTITDAASQETLFGIDQYNRLSSVTLPSKAATQFNYSNNTSALVSSTIDASGGSKQYTYDNDGHVTNVTLGKSPTSEVKQLVRDDHGRIQNLIRFRSTGDTSNSSAEVKRYVYDAKGNLVYKILPSGNVTEHEYDANGNRLTTRTYLAALYPITNLSDTAVLTQDQLVSWINQQPKNQVSLTTYQYNPQGQCKQITRFAHVDTNGQGINDTETEITQYNYDAFGRELLRTVTLNANVTVHTSHTYDALGRQLTENKANGDKLEWSYDDAHSKVTQTLASGLACVNEYDAGGLLSSVTDSDGSVSQLTSIARDARGYPFAVIASGQTEWQLHDSDGRLAFKIDALGYVIAYQYDGCGRKIQTTEYATAIDTTQLTLGQMSLTVPSNVNDRTTYKIFDEIGRLHYSIDAQGAVIEHQYDDAGYMLKTIRYATLLNPNSIAQLRAGTVIPTSSDDDRVSYYSYDTNGKLKYEQDADGYVTEYQYDALLREVLNIRHVKPIPMGQFNQMTQDPNDAVHYTYYDGQHKTGEVNAVGALTQYNYDQGGRLIQKRTYITPVKPTSSSTLDQLIPAQNPEDLVESYSYDSLNRLTQTTRSNNTQTNIAHNSFDQMTQLTKGAANDDPDSDIREYSYGYNEFGQLIWELNPRAARKISSIQENTDIDLETKTQFINQEIAENATTHAYDDHGLRISTTDPLQNTTIFYYDQKHQLSASINPEGGVIQYQYNAFGERIKTKKRVVPLSLEQRAHLCGGLITDDIESLIESVKCGNDIKTRTHYNNCGREKTLIDGEGYITQRDYNSFGEMSEEFIPVTSQGNSGITHIYTHNKRGLKATHSITGMDTQSTYIKDAWTYDAFGSLLTHTDGVGATTALSHDPLGNVLNKIDALQNKTILEWDTLNRKTSETNPLGLKHQYNYEQEKRITTETLPNGASRSKAHNAFDQETVSTDELGAQTIIQYEVGGNVASVKNPLGETTAYEYNINGSKIQMTEKNKLQTEYKLDGCDRPIQTACGVNLAPSQIQTSHTTYDGAGRKNSTTNAAEYRIDYTTDRNNNVTNTVTDANGLNHQVSHTYNGLKQVVSSQASDVNTPVPYKSETLVDVFGRINGRVRDPDQLKLTTHQTLDAQDRVLVSIDGEQHAHYYVRDILGRERFKINPKGGVNETRYDAAGHKIYEGTYITPIDTSSFAQTLPNESDIQKVLVSSVDDVFKHFVYNTDGFLQYVVKSSGAVTAYGLDVKGRPIETTQYATPVDLTSLKDFSATSIQSAIETSSDDRVSYRILNSIGQPIYSVDPEGYVVQYDYNSQQQLVCKTQFAQAINTANLNANSTIKDVAALIKPDASNDRMTRTIYDDFGNQTYCLRMTDATTAYVDEYQYDEVNSTVKTIHYSGELTLPTTFNTNTIASAIQSQNLSSNPLNRVKVISRDALKRKIKQVTCPDDAQINATEAWVYDALHRNLSHTDRCGYEWQFKMDGAGRKIASITPEVDVNTVSLSGDQYVLGKSQTCALTTGFSYDANDALLDTIYAQGIVDHHKAVTRDDLGKATSVSQTLPVDDLSATLEKPTDSPNQLKAVTESWLYDSAGREIIKPNKAHAPEYIVYGTNGKKAYVVDALGTVTQFSYNTFNEVTSIKRYATRISLTATMQTNGIRLSDIEPLIKSDPSNDRTVQMTYEKRGKLILQQEDARLMAHANAASNDTDNVDLQLALAQPKKMWSYNAFVEKVSEEVVISPDAKIIAQTIHRYDSLGREVLLIDPKGYVTVLDYDVNDKVVCQTEYANALTPSLNLLTASVDDIKTALANNASDMDQQTTKAYNPLGYLISETQKDVVCQQVQEISGLPTVTDLPAKDITTNYTVDPLGHRTSMSLPATTSAGSSTEYYGYNPLGQLSKHVKAPRLSGSDSQSNTLVPVRKHVRDVLGHEIALIDYQNSTPALSGDNPINVMPIHDATTRQTLKLTDAIGRCLLLQSADGNQSNWQQTSYGENGQVARRWSFLSHWQTDNSQQLTLTETKYIYDVLAHSIEEKVNDGSQNYVEFTTYNPFGEWISRGYAADNQPYVRHLDQTGMAWFGNQNSGVGEINITDGAGKVVLTMRSPVQDLSQATYASITDLANAPIDKVQQTICARDLGGYVSVQQQPGYTVRKSQPLLVDLCVGADANFGSYAITWPEPPYPTTNIQMKIWPKGHPEQTQTLTPTVKNNRSGIDVSAFETDAYDYSIDYFYVDPQSKAVSVDSYQSCCGELTLITANKGKSQNPIITIEDDSRLVIAGQDPDWKGVGLVQDGNLIKSVAINRTGGELPFADLSEAVTGTYDIVPIKTWNEVSSPPTIMWKQIKITHPENALHEVMPLALTLSDVPPMENGSQLVIEAETQVYDYDKLPQTSWVSTTQRFQWRYSLPKANASYNLYLDDIQQNLISKNTPGLSRVSCYLSDSQQKLWYLGMLNNPLNPILTGMPSRLGYILGETFKTDETYALSIGNQVLSVNPWMSADGVVDGSSLNLPMSQSVTLYELPNLTSESFSVGEYRLQTAKLNSNNMQYFSIEISNISIVNINDYEVSETEIISGWQLTYNITPGFLKKYTVEFDTHTVILFQRSVLLPSASLWGPNHQYPIMSLAIAFLQMYWTEYFEPIPISAFVWLFDDKLTIFNDVIPVSTGKNQFSLPDARAIYFSLPGIQDAKTVQFDYADTTFTSVPVWTPISNVAVTKTGFVVPASDILAGRYQYRLKVLDANNQSIDLSNITTVSDGYAVGMFSTSNNQYFTSKAPDQAIVTPKRTQQTDRWGRIVSETNERGFTTTTDYHRYSKQKFHVHYPPVDVTDEHGQTQTGIVGTECFGVDEHAEVIAHKNENQSLTIHQRNAANQVVKTLQADGVWKAFTVDGFGQQTSITSPLPDGSQATIKQIYDLRGCLTQEVDALNAVKSYTYDVLKNRISETNALGNVTRYNYNRFKKIVMRRLPGGETTEYVLQPQQKVLSQTTKSQTDSQVLNWTYDKYSIVKTQTDLSGTITEYLRNYNQQVIEEIGHFPAGETYAHGVRYIDDQYPRTTEPVPENHLQHVHDEAGHEVATIDIAMGQTTRYVIDPDGVRASEWFQTNGEMYQFVTRTRNARGWMDSQHDTRYAMKRLFDLVGNIRSVQVAYFDNGSLTPIPSMDRWFTYDKASQMLIADGALVNNQIAIIKDQGMQLSYTAGFRTQELSIDKNGTQVTKSLTYQPNGLLKATQSTNGANQHFGFDANNFRTHYDEVKITDADDDVLALHPLVKAIRSASSTDHITESNTPNANGWVVTQSHSDDKGSNTVTFSNFDATGQAGYQVNQMPYGVVDRLTTIFNEFTTKQTAMVIGTRDVPHEVAQTHATLTATQTSNGDTESVQGDIKDSFRYFIVNGQHLIVLKRTGVKSGSTEYYFYDPDGNMVGRAGDLPPNMNSPQDLPKDIDFTLNVHAVSENWPPPAPPTYLVSQDGLTFNDVARSVYGDQSLGDVIAVANGYKASDTVPSGMNLTVPPVVSSLSHNWEGQYPVYNSSSIIGSLYPNIPIPEIKKPHHHGGFFGDLFGAIISVVLAIVLPELLPEILAAELAGLSLVETDMVIGALTAAISDVANQVVEIAFDNQHGFNVGEVFKSLGEGLIQGFAMGINGLRYSGKISSPQTWKLVSNQLKVSIVKTAIDAVAHKGQIDWRSMVMDVTQTVVSAGFSNTVGDEFNPETGRVVGRMFSTAVSDIEQDALYGVRLDWENIAADSIGSGIGQALGDRINVAIARKEEEQENLQWEKTLEENQRLAQKTDAFMHSDPFNEMNHDAQELWGPSWEQQFSASAYRDMDNAIYNPSENIPYGTLTRTPKADVSRRSIAEASRQREIDRAHVVQHIESERRQLLTLSAADIASRSQPNQLQKTFASTNGFGLFGGAKSDFYTTSLDHASDVVKDFSEEDLKSIRSEISERAKTLWSSVSKEGRVIRNAVDEKFVEIDKQLIQKKLYSLSKLSQVEKSLEHVHMSARMLGRVSLFSSVKSDVIEVYKTAKNGGNWEDRIVEVLAAEAVSETAGAAMKAVLAITFPEMAATGVGVVAWGGLLLGSVVAQNYIFDETEKLTAKALHDNTYKPD